MIEVRSGFPAESPKRRFYSALEGMRAVGALAILVYHTFFKYHGYLAVDLFVILSGFVVAHSALDRDPRPGGAHFVRRRVARLYPLHVFALGAFVVAYLYRHHALPDYPDGQAFTLLQHLTMLHSVGFNPSGLTWNYPAWAVSVEFWINVALFYLIPPRVRSGQLLLLAIAAYLLLFNAFRPMGLDLSYQVAWGGFSAGLVRGIGGFALGWLVFRLHERILPATRSRVLWTLIELVALCGIAGVMLRPLQTAVGDFAALPCFAVLVTALACERGLLGLSLSSPPMQFLGRISYGIFLLHIPVQEVLYANDINVATMGAVRYTILFAAVVVAAATAAHYVIESPIRRWSMHPGYG